MAAVRRTLFSVYLCNPSIYLCNTLSRYSCIKHGGETAALTARYRCQHTPSPSPPVFRSSCDPFCFSMMYSWAEFFGRNCRKMRRAICRRQRAAVLPLNTTTVGLANTKQTKANNSYDNAAEGVHSDARRRSDTLLLDQESAGKAGRILPPIGSGCSTNQTRPAPWIPAISSKASNR